MAKFKVGDRVTIKKDLYVGGSGTWGKNSVVLDMLEYAGKTFTISTVISEGHYSLVEIPWGWTDRMFEGFEAEDQSYSVNLVYAKFEHNEKPYLYEVPVGITISKDDMIFVETRSGETYVKAFTDSFSVGVGALDAIKLSSGIGLNPLKKVVGRAKHTYKKVEF